MNNNVINKVSSQVARRPALLIVIPWLLYAMYLMLLAAPKYESVSQLVVKSSDSANNFDPSSMLMSGVTGVSSSNDSQLVVSFIRSADMLHYLDQTIALREHYMSDVGDVFSRLPENHSDEDFLEFYQDNTQVVIDSASGIIELSARAFEASYAQLINQTIVNRAEWFINEISNDLAKSRLSFAQREHDIVQQKLQDSKLALLDFQSKYNVLDPNAEGAAFQQIAFSLEATLAQKEAELNTMSSIMSESASQVISLKRQIRAIKEQIASQKNKINDVHADGNNRSINQLMAQYSNLKVQMELSLQAYSASLMTLENARVETYQQILHLVTIESPRLPDDAKYPKTLYNLVLLGVLLTMVLIAGRIVVATIKEL
ncbi:capsule biosynthesis protein [Alteromonas gilva]|uniref:Capsule biosynthesis protein n=1 Tax=Alteromonas gilva TaxID=2987522 RepID=A0ABT5L881_9ALTE|nr:capsule biosynthesis protein [Alteromonas gilva]MDC8832674.1 capsule biosynthesis protein [Alteromonas gilva]